MNQLLVEVWMQAARVPYTLARVPPPLRCTLASQMEASHPEVNGQSLIMIILISFVNYDVS